MATDSGSASTHQGIPRNRGPLKLPPSIDPARKLSEMTAPNNGDEKSNNKGLEDCGAEKPNHPLIGVANPLPEISVLFLES